MRHAICYISSKHDYVDLQQIVELLELSYDNNIHQGVKGLLLYSEGNFFQILEGPKKVVLALFEEIKIDPRHHGIIQIIGKDIEHGSIDGYKVDIIKEEYKVQHEVPAEYMETIKGVSPEVKKNMARMLETFITTR